MRRITLAMLAIAVTVSLVPTAAARLRPQFTAVPKAPVAGQPVTLTARGCDAAPCRYQWAERAAGSNRIRLLTHGWRRSARLVLSFAAPGRKYVVVRIRNAQRRTSAWTYADGGTRRSRRRALTVTPVANSPAPGGGAPVPGLATSATGAPGTSPGGAPGDGTPSGGAPPPEVLPAPYAPCTATAATTAAAASALASAPAGGVVCLADGAYGALNISAARATDATLRAENPGAAHLTGATLAGSHYAIAGFDVQGTVQLQAGANAIRVSHNDIHNGSYGVSFASTDCTVANAPTWAGCAPQAPIANAVIDGNRIHDVSTDALYTNNWRNTRISGNEIYGIVENGAHNDCLQSVFGGSGMVFDHNYEHDNNCQGFFIKDGDASNVTLTQNLFVRNRAINANENTVQVYNTAGFVFRNNTDWSGNGWVIRGDGAGNVPSATVDHNYIYAAARITDSGRAYTLTEDYDTFHSRPSGFTMGSHSNVLASPAFVSTATDDYRVAGSDRGIDWRPADMHFGP